MALCRQGKFEEASDEVERALARAKDFGDALELKKTINGKLLAVYYDMELSACGRYDCYAAGQRLRTSEMPMPSTAVISRPETIQTG
ncbi:MAG: hypothetical protein LLG37_06115 [Spirochaetia bacterium]|nr:hypothetical protein [Spirochaetia bacterium]